MKITIITVGKIKEKYLKIARGDVPEDIEEINLPDSSLNICELLVKIGFATSKSEAKRQIAGNGIKINGVLETDINQEISINDGLVIQFGKNKFKKIRKK